VFEYNNTLGGYELLAKKETDIFIGAAPSVEQIDFAEENGTTFKYTQIGSEAFVFFVNKDNPITSLTVEQIKGIYSGKITNWSEVGGKDGEIVCIGREESSGTRDGFESITDTEDACVYRQELTSNGAVLTAVAENPNAIGYVSLSSVKDTVKAISVSGVAPSEATIKDGRYAVQRPFVLVTKEGVALSETAQAFFDFATSSAANEIISAAGVVPVN
jgi:phosphate transport system substrate-binding protein